MRLRLLVFSCALHLNSHSTRFTLITTKQSIYFPVISYISLQFVYCYTGLVVIIAMIQLLYPLINICMFILYMYARKHIIHNMDVCVKS